MPVALSEWRVRIGTFVHRIKEYVVREMREELLRERIQRLRVLWKRLKAMEGDSEGGSQDKEARQDEVDSSDSSLVNQQGDCNAEPSTKTGQDSPQSCCVGSDALHHEPSSQTVMSHKESASLSTTTHSKVCTRLCPSRPFLSSFLSPSFYYCFPLIFLFSFLCLPLGPVFGISLSVSLSFLVVVPFLLSLFLSPFLPFSRREQSFGECHTFTASPVSNGSNLKEVVDKELPQQPNPNLQESMLVRAGDVELNPGPRQGTIDSALQDMELVLLAKDVPGDNYYELCICMGFSYIESKNLLTEHHLNIPGALLELFGRWKIKQRDGTNCRTVLGEILEKANMGALQTKLLEGGYLKSDKNVPSKGKPQEAMTEEQVSQCAEDLKSFYLEQMCKIKPDPLDFNLIVQFEQLYTNLVLLRHDKGLTRDTLPLDYKNLFTTRVDGVLPKRLLVEGEGGVGKTTLCSKIARDWSEGCDEYKQFKWVLVIPLRNVIKGQTIGDCMKYYLNENNIVSPEQIEHFMISQPSKVLIVLDGFDEYDGDLSNNDRSGISQVLRLDKFKQCTVLVTTRPWKAHEIKCNKGLCGSYAFIAVKGFSAENVSSYISKYFVKDVDAGKELIRFIEVNDVIKENMAPFPIYVAMLCILWENIDIEKRETIRRLKTFSQLFEQMIIFLKDHYVSKLKATNTLNEELLKNEYNQAEVCIKQIGLVAFSGVLMRKLAFKGNDFRSLKDAMETCCKVGILSRDHEHVSRWKRSMRDSPAVTNVFFPHKLFQEYVAALYLASLHETDREEFIRSTGKVMGANVQEFRYLLYFTAAQVKEIGLEIVKMLQGSNQIHPALMQDIVGCSPSILPRGIDYTFLVDVTFEAYDKDIAKAVGQRIFAEKRTLKIDKNMSAHTVSGYMFIMEQHQVETLELRRNCGPTVSRDIADLLSSPTSLTTLKILETYLDDEFYSLALNVSKRGEAFSIVQELHIDDRFLCGLRKFDTAIKTIFPNLKRLRILTLHTVSPVMVEQLAQASLEVLYFERGHDSGERSRQPVPLIGDPVSLGHLFSESFQQLTSLVFKKLMIGNIRTRSILQSLKKHQHLKTIRIFACFTDNELDPLAEQINAENRIKVTLQHDEEQSSLKVKPSTDLIDALCHRTSVCEWTVKDFFPDRLGKYKKKDDLCFPDLHGREVDSKIHIVSLYDLNLVSQQSGSCCLGRFLSLLPRLTDLTVVHCFFHDDFYRETAERASSSQIHTVKFDCFDVVYQQSGSCYLGRFLSLLPRLTHLKISSSSFHDDFYREIAEHASLSQIHTVKFDDLFVVNQQSGTRCLGRFLSLLPRLTDLKIFQCNFHDDFYREIAERASSSQIHIVEFRSFHVLKQQSGSCYLGRFLCLLPRLTDLTINCCSFHDDFYREIAERASSSQIHTVRFDGLVLVNQQSGSCYLGRFLSLLPRLTDLTISSCSFHDDFYREIAEGASSSQSPYFMERKHIPLLDKYWPRLRELQSPAESSSSAASANHSETEPSQHRMHHQLVRVPLPQVISPATYFGRHDHIAKYAIPKATIDTYKYAMFPRTVRIWNRLPGHVILHGNPTTFREAALPIISMMQPPAVLKRQEQPTQMEPNILLPSSSSNINSLMLMHERGSSIGNKPLFEHDDDHCMPSTSGITSLSCLQREHPTDTDPISNDLILVSGKRIHSESSDDTKDDKEATEKSVKLMDARPRKRRAKTDRDPASP
ncbi:LOW QUALITY PROTEIN: uncharacterized protein LOC121421003 [Lytechinus variegatus]|uniref:LOW QUALITY PROTEIN: uncharacterized protein LOC121421003 n=1 Tax=Lytechinus variegatus TaxID=7654 RepID=UPI001BB1D8E8|nr:LOW QUALITY PROTEIN: uncharacterized protein LOC121421003 [Lytechinus variegatus]